jgi:hypothetical protein
MLTGHDVMSELLSARRELLHRQVRPRPIRETPQFDASLPELIRAVREYGPWQNGSTALMCQASGSGAPGKNCLSNRGQEVVIAGYSQRFKTPTPW